MFCSSVECERFLAALINDIEENFEQYQGKFMNVVLMKQCFSPQHESKTKITNELL